jgi:hypothetical protein
MADLVPVTGVAVLGPHRLRVLFEDGTVGDLDFSRREWRGIFEPLQDPAFFAQVRVDPDLGTLAWPNGADMAPETLYKAARQNPVRPDTAIA